VRARLVIRHLPLQIDAVPPRQHRPSHRDRLRPLNLAPPLVCGRPRVTAEAHVPRLCRMGVPRLLLAAVALLQRPQRVLALLRLDLLPKHPTHHRMHPVPTRNALRLLHEGETAQAAPRLTGRQGKLQLTPHRAHRLPIEPPRQAEPSHQALPTALSGQGFQEPPSELAVLVARARHLSEALRLDPTFVLPPDVDAQTVVEGMHPLLTLPRRIEDRVPKLTRLNAEFGQIRVRILVRDAAQQVLLQVSGVEAPLLLPPQPVPPRDDDLDLRLPQIGNQLLPHPRVPVLGLDRVATLHASEEPLIGIQEYHRPTGEGLSPAVLGEQLSQVARKGPHQLLG